MRTALALLVLLALSAVEGVLATPALAQETSDDRDLATSLENRYRAAIEAAERVTVSVLVDREEEPKTNLPRRRSQLLNRTDSVFTKRPLDRPTSGTIIDADGLILTTAFNVTGGKIKSVRVVLPDGRDLPAKVVGFDQPLDLALLEVEAENLPTLEATRLERLRPGMMLVAAGRGPDGRGLTINPGVFSAPGRDHGRTVQMDCRMNYGNVGGPLLDTRGNLVGITCKVSTANAARFGQNSGVSFAIPWNQLQRTPVRLKRGVKIKVPKTTFLGIAGRARGAKFHRLVLIPPFARLVLRPRVPVLQRRQPLLQCVG